MMKLQPGRNAQIIGSHTNLSMIVIPAQEAFLGRGYKAAFPCCPRSRLFGGDKIRGVGERMNNIISLLPSSALITDPVEMQPYLTSWRGGYTGKAACVALPENTQQVAEIVRSCNATRTPMVPQGGNTGLVAGSVPDETGDAVIISLKRMRAIRNLDVDNMSVTAEAGCILTSIQQEAENAGLLFPLSMASEGSAMLGGMLSTNAGGTAVLKYGTTRDLVLGVEAVLPDGNIYSNLSGLRKDNTGYCVDGWFIGAEGTLGIITAATIKLVARPTATATAMLAVADVSAALGLFRQLRKRLGDNISAFELIAGEAMQLVIEHMDLALPFAEKYPYYILMECGTTLSGVDLNAALESALAEIWEEGSICDAVIASSLQQRAELWQMREEITESARKAGRGVHFDISIPTSGMPGFIEQTREKIRTQFSAVHPIIFGHLGDGNLHFNQLLPKDMPDAAFEDTKIALQTLVYDACAASGGSISAEHGIGRERRAAFYQHTDPVKIACMQKLKAALDPEGLMHPGVIFPLL